MAPTTSLADDDRRAQFNYMTHCQGCHLPGAIGAPGAVPRMKGFLGYFLHTQEGREFIIQVPGVATSSLPDDEMTELINWLLRTYSAEQLPKQFRPFSVGEVGKLRLSPVKDPVATRKMVLDRISVVVPELADDPTFATE
jgi:hypothetical protein